MTSALTKQRRKKQQLDATMATLRDMSSLYIQLADWVEESWPSILRPTTIDLWLQSVDRYAEHVQTIQDSVSWLLRADALVKAGQAEYRPSQTKPGDLDLWGRREDFEAPPLMLQEAFADPDGQSSTLGAEPLSTGAIVLIAIGIIGATASIVTIGTLMIEQTQKDRATIRAGLIAATQEAVQAGTISEDFAARVLHTIDVWTKAEANQPVVKFDLDGLLTVAALGGIGYGLYRLLSKYDK